LRTHSALSSSGVPGNASSSTAVLAASAAVLLVVARSQVGVTTRQARSNEPSEPSPGQTKRMRVISKRSKKHIAFLNGRQVRERVDQRTGKKVDFPMHVKPGDVVQVMKGKDAGLVTQVLKTYPTWKRVLCENANMCIKHVKPLKPDDEGERVRVEAPLDVSNVMHYSEEDDTVSLVGMRYQQSEDGDIERVRYYKATGKVIPDREAPEWKPELERAIEEADGDE